MTHEPVRPQLVVGFDLDMTLVDSRPGILATLEALGAETGAPVTGHDMLDALLRGNIDLEFAERFPADDAARWADRFRELYVEFGVPGTDLLPGAHESVDAVHDAGGRVVVVTAKYEPNALRCLTHVGLTVDAVFGWRYADGKADTLIEEAATIYVGDTPNDVRAAARAGAHMVAVTTGPHAAGELRDAGATTVLDSLVQFPPWLRAARLAPRRPRRPGHSKATIASATKTTATTTSTTRFVSSTEVDASMLEVFPLVPATVLVPPGSSTFTVSPNTSRMSARSV